MWNIIDIIFTWGLMGFLIWLLLFAIFSKPISPRIPGIIKTPKKLK